MREALASLGVDSTSSPGSSRTRRSAMAVSAGSPPASWKAWRPSTSRRMATAFAMPTACSARKSPTAGRSSCPKPGSTTAIRGNSSAASAPSRSASAARSNRSPPRHGRLERHVWKPTERVLAVAYDTPVVGWRGNRVNTLRLWSAMPIDPILLDAFNAGDHIGALRESNKAEALSRVLYPADSPPGRPGTAAAAGVFLLRRPRCRTSSSAISASMAIWCRCPTRRRSISTTPIRRSPSPN